jgi:Ca2+:H+ antiporter
MGHIINRGSKGTRQDVETGETADDATRTGHSSQHSEQEGDDEEEEVPKLSLWGALLMLVGVTVITGITAEFLVSFPMPRASNLAGRVTLSQVSSIEGFVATGNVNEEFIALILLPIVGNAAEHVCWTHTSIDHITHAYHYQVTAVTVSYKNRLDLAMSVAVGSSIQIALFVVPFLVLLGWIINQPLSLCK